MPLAEYSTQELIENPELIEKGRKQAAKEMDLPETATWQEIRAAMFLEMFRLKTLMIS